MPVYTYRALIVELYNKHGREAGEKRRRGSSVDRFFYVTDTELDGRVDFTDEDGDDHEQFLERAQQAFIEYLNELGRDGCKVIQCTTDFPINEWPRGRYFLIRESPE